MNMPNILNNQRIENKIEIFLSVQKIGQNIQDFLKDSLGEIERNWTLAYAIICYISYASGRNTKWNNIS